MPRGFFEGGGGGIAPSLFGQNTASYIVGMVLSSKILDGIKIHMDS